MAAVTDADVQALLGATPGSPGAVIPVITSMAKAYTRGRGFISDEPNDEIAAVITTASARLISNIKQTSHSQGMGDLTVDIRTYFQGWTLAEQTVLNRYRVRAM
ncbi:hypothetical protein BH11ACT7_BH11ACT7_20540 [soil metagenome]